MDSHGITICITHKLGGITLQGPNSEYSIMLSGCMILVASKHPQRSLAVSWPPTECADLVLLDFSTLLQLPHLWQYIQAIGAIGWCLNKRDLENNMLVRTSEPKDLAPTELSSASPTTLKDAQRQIRWWSNLLQTSQKGLSGFSHSLYKFDKLLAEI